MKNILLLCGLLIFLSSFIALPALAVEPPSICIDPGHPSETADGRWKGNGHREVDVCWRMALVLKDVLDERKITSFLTKARVDQMVTNRERAEMANRANAAMLLRLHCDAGGSGGFTVYAPDKQGKSQGVQGPTLEIIQESTRAGKIFHAAMAKRLQGVLKDGGLRGDTSTSVGKRQGALTGSIFAKVPAVLVEMCHLTKKSDAQFITSPKGERLMAEALADGVEAWLQNWKTRTRNPENTAH